VGRTLTPSFANIDLHGTKGVDREPLVRVNGNTEEARVGIDELVYIPHYRVPENAGISQVGKVGHIIRAVKLGRVNLADLLFLEDFDLTTNFN
jgi:hypothetical protein